MQQRNQFELNSAQQPATTWYKYLFHAKSSIKYYWWQNYIEEYFWIKCCLKHINRLHWIYRQTMNN